MAAELIKLAQYFIENGFPEFGKKVEELAITGRKEGVPEYRGPPPNLMDKIIEGLFYESTTVGLNFYGELGQHFSLVVGGNLPDNVRLADLDIRTLHDDRLKNIPRGTKSNYTKGLMQLIQHGYSTVGSVRALTYDDIFSIRNIGESTAALYSLAFRQTN